MCAHQEVECVIVIYVKSYSEARVIVLYELYVMTSREFTFNLVWDLAEFILFLSFFNDFIFLSVYFYYSFLIDRLLLLVVAFSALPENIISKRSRNSLSKFNSNETKNNKNNKTFSLRTHRADFDQINFFIIIANRAQFYCLKFQFR